MSVPAPRFLHQFACLGLTLALASGISGCGGGGSAPASSAPPTQTLGALVDSFATAAMQSQQLPGMTVALAKNGTMLYAKAYGSANLATQAPTQTSTIFQIGSITDEFTCALILKLQEQGKLSVDDSITKYLPQYNFPAAITLRMLLTYTSGLPDYTTFAQAPSWAANGVSEATVLTAVSQAPLMFPPGTQWFYSNSNQFALGAIIETVTGQSYAANLNQFIVQPLGLTNTFYTLPPPAQSAIGYTLGTTGPIPAAVVDRSAAFAAGALSTNLYDFVAWDAGLISGKVISAASFKEMTTPSSTDKNGGSYGFGIGLRNFNNRPTIWHNGGISGFQAETDVFLDSGFTVVVLINLNSANPDAIAQQIIGAVCNSSQFSSNC